MGVPHAPTAAPQAPAAARDAAPDPDPDPDHYCPLAQLASFALLALTSGESE